MKTHLLIVTCISFGSAMAQTPLYSEDFEAGNSFTLNTTDLGGGSTENTWLVNNAYTGGTGTFICLGFPFNFTIPATTNQPVGITNSPTSTYMHIAAQAAVGAGINCASYVPADGTCVSVESNFSRMTSPVSTSGFTAVTFDLWWMCGGSAAAFGELYYSIDGGMTWTLKQSTLNNTLAWTQSSFTDAAWDNQSSLLFALRFVSNTATTGSDPGFCVDDIEIFGTPGVTSDISNVSTISTSWCEGDTEMMTVDFDATGTMNAGNVYELEISDASGSFASPTVIGTLASTATGTLTITGNAPGTLPAGSGYRVRVNATDPVTVGTDNGTDLVINALPTVTFSSVADFCITDIPYTLTEGSPTGGMYTGTGVTGNVFSPLVAGVGSWTVTYEYMDVNGCSGQMNQTLVVDGCVGIDENSVATYSIYPNPTTGSFSILGEQDIQGVQIIDLNGKSMKTFEQKQDVYSLEGFPTGVYVVRIQTSKGMAHSKVYID